MRIALHATGEVGRRAGLILLAEPGLTALGLYGHSGRTEDRRTTAIRELTGYPVLVTDEPAERDAFGLAGIAADDGLSAVLAVAATPDGDLVRRYGDAGTTLLLGADLAGIATTLAGHEAAARPDGMDLTVAWTVPGTPLRRGEAVPFPDPIGARWGRRVPVPGPGDGMAGIEVPVDGPWAGVVARVAAEGRQDRIVGVADLDAHLRALALAAGALAVVRGEFPAGVRYPAEAGSAYLQHALEAGLEVAAFTMEG